MPENSARASRGRGECDLASYPGPHAERGNEAKCDPSLSLLGLGCCSSPMVGHVGALLTSLWLTLVMHVEVRRGNLELGGGGGGGGGGELGTTFVAQR